jgi:hypothetical protein
LKLLREQIRGKNTREVYTGDAARELGIEMSRPHPDISNTKST